MPACLGFDALLASDAETAAAALRERGDKIRAVILDLTMPHVGGLECLRELRHIKADVRVIISSGYGEQDALQKFPSGTVSAFLHKPYRVDELRRCLDRTLRGVVSTTDEPAHTHGV